MTAHANPVPWYREPWPWIVMAGPAIVVVAGFATAFIAFRSGDGLIAADYYKQGLAINRVLEREARAQALGVRASVQFSDSRERVRVILRMPGPAPARLRLALVHPTRAGQDQSIALRLASDGVYVGEMAIPASSILTLHLEDTAGAWRVAAQWPTEDSSVELGNPR